MYVFLLALILATFLCSLVAGFLFAFAVVVMPGIGSLSDQEFLRAFQVMDLMDRIIQQNQPLFLLVWVGSVVALVTSAVLGIGQLDGGVRLVIVCATLVYLGGVQLPTFRINVPLNNRLQTMEFATMDEAAVQAAREAFEPRWNRWNVVRTIFASLASVLLIVLLFRF